MKKLFILIAGLSLLAGTYAWGQVRKNTDIFIGPVAGFGDSWVSNMNGAPRLIPSGYAGIDFIDFVDTHFAFGGLLTASDEGYNLDLYSHRNEVRPLYLRLPLRLYYFFGERSIRVRPYLFFGPSFACKLAQYNLSAEENAEVSITRSPDVFNNFDAGFDGGGGITITLTKKIALNAGMEYYKGLTAAFSKAGDEIGGYNHNNHDVDLSAGLLLRIR